MSEKITEERDATLGEPTLSKPSRKKTLQDFFLFITSSCNSNCRTCFYHDNLNKQDDLTFEQIKNLSETAGRFDKLWISGGEPFMRKDMVEIIEMFVKNNKVKTINLPTNGLLKDNIVKMTGELLERCPNLTIYLNFSLDGIGTTHDKIRGVPGNFKKTIESMEAVREKYGDRKKLLINVATVITREGAQDFLPLASYLNEKNLIDLQTFEVVRGDPPDPELKGFTLDEVKQIHKDLYPVLDKNVERLFKDLNSTGKKIARSQYMGIYKLMFNIKEDTFIEPNPWPYRMKCTAGKTTLVIDANGDFRACEMREPVGNLRDYNYDAMEALKSDAMKNEVKTIGGGKGANCWCAHGCWILASLRFSPHVSLFKVPKLAKEYEAMGKAEGKELPEVNIQEIESYLEKEKK